MICLSVALLELGIEIRTDRLEGLPQVRQDPFRDPFAPVFQHKDQVDMELGNTVASPSNVACVRHGPTYTAAMPEVKAPRDGKAVMQQKRETMARHKAMRVRQYECKITAGKLLERQREALWNIFKDAKAFYNAVVTSPDVFAFNFKVREVPVKFRDKSKGPKAPLEETTRVLTNLTCQMRQDLVKRAKSAIKTLAALKKKGIRVGRLKPKKFVGSIPLREHGTTYRIVDREKQTLKIAGIPGHVRARGLVRIPEDSELANATLIKREGDYYVKITAFEKPEDLVPKSVLGVDFGVKTALTFSNGIKVETEHRIGPAIRKACQRMSKTKRGSRNRKKMRCLLRKRHAKRIRRMENARRKILHATRIYQMAVQDDNIGGWQVLWGAKVQANAIGAIKSGWKNIPTTLVVDRFVRTTRACRFCGALVELGLEVRIFVCPHCAHTEDRDLHSSRAIAVLAINNQPQELRCLPVETTASTGMLAILQRIPGISASLVDETGSLALKGEVVHALS